jgi:ubiquinol-cytochrome c reductase cytochrome c1 subunit
MPGNFPALRRGAAALFLGSIVVCGARGSALAQEGPAAEVAHYPIEEPERHAWSFDGFFGVFDPGQLRRGLKVYREVCAACHGLEKVAFRMLADEGGPELSPLTAAEIAASYTVSDGPNEQGEMFQRRARLSDTFPSPFPNLQAAAFANNGAAPPDLSLIAKARSVSSPFPGFITDILTFYEEAGPDYVRSFLTGYREPPEGYQLPPGTFYNPYFISGAATAMPPPLFDGQVSYEDGTPGTVEQYAADVTAFLMWAAEPHLVARKHMGFQVILFLLVFVGLIYASKRRLWATAH